jgi:hypothetical protein
MVYRQDSVVYEAATTCHSKFVSADILRGRTKVYIKLNLINAVGRERFTGLPLWTGWVDREAISLLFFPLLLRLAFVFMDKCLQITRPIQQTMVTLNAGLFIGPRSHFSEDTINFLNRSRLSANLYHDVSQREPQT